MFCLSEYYFYVYLFYNCDFPKNVLNNINIFNTKHSAYPRQIFSVVHVARSLLFCELLCRSLFVLLSLFHVVIVWSVFCPYFTWSLYRLSFLDLLLLFILTFIYFEFCNEATYPEVEIMRSTAHIYVKCQWLQDQHRVPKSEEIFKKCN